MKRKTESYTFPWLRKGTKMSNCDAYSLSIESHPNTSQSRQTPPRECAAHQLVPLTASKNAADSQCPRQYVNAKDRDTSISCQCADLQLLVRLEPELLPNVRDVHAPNGCVNEDELDLLLDFIGEDD